MEVSARRVARCAAALAALALPQLVEAHSFGRSYNLPVPLWLYAWAAMAALLLSFVLIGWFLTSQHSHGPANDHALPLRTTQVAKRLLPLLRLVSVMLLLLCIVTGLLGHGDSYRNFNMTWFWIMFVLGFAYLTVLVGDLYAHINPWATLAALIGRVSPRFTQGCVRYPAWLAYWPALALYAGFIWIELFGRTSPHSLSLWLLVYTAINLAGVWLFGALAWFRHGEFFAVFLRLLALIAPLRVKRGALHWRMPFAGLLHERAGHGSLLVFVLFMLSSTAFDGLHATVPWFQVFWSEPLASLRALAGTHPTEAYLKLRSIHLCFESLSLLLSPLLYLAAYLACLALAKVLLRSPIPLRELALRFALSLLPIAFVYHFTHYFTLLLTQGPAALPLLSDPLGRGWDLFGTARWGRPLLPDMAWVWHTQVGLILFGHVASVALAHIEALHLFGRRREALISQLPMLLLMMAFTVAGLWILAQPLQGGA
ncbi:MAG: hypothetical protein V4709_08040 [Pseudomonadota bacterium]